MNLFETPWELFSSFFIFGLGGALALATRKFFRCTYKRALVLYVWHSFFSIVYALYILNYGGDAAAYYNKGLAGNVTFDLGTQAVEIITFFFVKGVGLSFLGVSLVFHFFGFIGLIAFDAALREVTKYSGRNIRILGAVLVFLPSVSFWSAGLGKDAISFMAVGLMLWSCLALKRRFFFLLIAIFSMLLVRPHMAAIIVMSFALSIILKKNIRSIHRTAVGALALFASAIFVPYGLEYAGVGSSSSPNDVIAYIEERQSHNLSGGSSLEISDMTLPMQLLTYLIRPLPFEAHNVSAFMASIDNLVLVIMLLLSLRPLFFRRAPIELSGHNRLFLWVYVAVSWTVLATTTANLGIAMRQKWMFIPILMFLLISLMGKRSAPLNRTGNQHANSHTWNTNLN